MCMYARGVLYIRKVHYPYKGMVIVCLCLPDNKDCISYCLMYRVYDAARGVYTQDCDDDGESAAGGRLLHLLQVTQHVDLLMKGEFRHCVIPSLHTDHGRKECDGCGDEMVGTATHY